MAALSAVCMASVWAGFARLSGGVGGAGLRAAAAGLPELKSGLALKRAGTLLALLAREKRPTPGRGDSSLAGWNENPGLCSAAGRAEVEGAPALASSAREPAAVESQSGGKLVLHCGDTTNRRRIGMEVCVDILQKLVPYMLA